MTAPRADRPDRPRPRFRTLEVRRVSHLTPRMIRVTVGGPELDGFEQPAPTQHIKLILPQRGQDRPIIPDPSLPKGAFGEGPRPLMRTYTIRRLDVAQSEMDIDVAIHGEGEASDWAARVKPGGIVALAGPGGRPHNPHPNTAWYVMAGDESALPAMGALLDAIPTSVPIRMYAEVPDPAEHLDWNRPNLDVAWLDRAAGTSSAGVMLETALTQAEPPSGNGQVWLACEAAIMRRIRQHLLNAWRLDPSVIVTRGYWKQGEVNYRDGDYGDD
ncbi:MAG TPA: siderophore-interacting protein [Chloroflexota bacterium]|nr:siderophore-interacting protein [Chloroflexota bacterium]